jgi:hypothetical protein
MGLNQDNFKEYQQLEEGEKSRFLNRQLQNNILSFYKGLSFRISDHIMVTSKLNEKNTLFKDKSMLAFEGVFTSNAYIPDLAGIGKAVSRGFGTVILI